MTEPIPYLGYWISQVTDENAGGAWCRTVAEKQYGGQRFALVERLPYLRTLHSGWPASTEAAHNVLRRQGLGIARALMALDEAPVGQFAQVVHPIEGPPYQPTDEGRLSLLMLQALANLETTFRYLKENRLDVRGIGDLLWSRSEFTERTLDRLIDSQQVEFVDPERLEDGFWSLKITEPGRRFLEERARPSLSGGIRGFDVGSSEQDEAMPATSDKPAGGARKPRIFLAHGRDGEAREGVARWLQNGGVGVTILAEKPNSGRTLIEKFEEEGAAADYAVVLATGDDEGRLIGEPELRPRMRQNVTLELGYFLGKLGRGRIATLVRGDPELPSDYGGIAYIPFDDHGGWKLALAKELRAAGLPFDEQSANA